MGNGRSAGGPNSAVVIGAGIVGLSTAWFLQERGVQVTVVDAEDVAAGASWGNAGYLSPALAIPLNEPSVVRYGLRALLDPQAPLHIPATLDPALWCFLARFAAHCTWREWERVVRAQQQFNAECLEAFDVLTSNGVEAPTIEAPVTAAFENPGQAVTLVRELERIKATGQEIRYGASEGSEARTAVPQLSSQIGATVTVAGQRYLDPGQFVRALAQSVIRRGATIRSGFRVTRMRARGNTHVVESATGETVGGQSVVLATGAWLDELGADVGIRVPVRAGRGYSFTVPTEDSVPGPIYLPSARVACTPYQGGLRVAGTMEFRHATAPLETARIEAIIGSVRNLLTGVGWQERHDEWVGPRPVTSDGAPLVGATRAAGVFVAGGHGMWGLTHGPVSARLLTEQITTGKQPAGLRPFDPLR